MPRRGATVARRGAIAPGRAAASTTIVDSDDDDSSDRRGVDHFVLSTVSAPAVRSFADYRPTHGSSSGGSDDDSDNGEGVGGSRGQSAVTASAAALTASGGGRRGVAAAVVVDSSSDSADALAFVQPRRGRDVGKGSSSDGSDAAVVCSRGRGDRGGGGRRRFGCVLGGGVDAAGGVGGLVADLTDSDVEETVAHKRARERLAALCAAGGVDSGGAGGDRGGGGAGCAAVAARAGRRGRRAAAAVPDGSPDAADAALRRAEAALAAAAAPDPPSTPSPPVRPVATPARMSHGGGAGGAGGRGGTDPPSAWSTASAAAPFEVDAASTMVARAPPSSLPSSAAAVAPAISPEAARRNRVLGLKVRPAGGRPPTTFRVKGGYALERIRLAYAKKLGVDPSAVRFLVDGDTVSATDTANDLDLEDGDLIDVVVRG